MKYINLGKTNIKVSIIGLGCWQFGDKRWGWNSEINENIAIKIINKSIEIGINFFDTAEIYGDGISESILGKALKDYRNEVVIATKVWPRHLRYDDLIKACNKSLKRLNTDYIDLYQIHWPNLYVPLKETAKALETLYKENKIRSIGVSNFSVPLIKELNLYLENVKIASNQIHYNLIERIAEKEIIPYCLKNKITIISFSPLEQGLLTGKYSLKNLPKDEIRSNSVYFKKENLSKILNIVEEIRKISLKYNKSISQISLNWLIKHPNVVAIPGAKSVKQLIENAYAAEFELSKDDYLFLTKLSDNLKINYV